MKKLVLIFGLMVFGALPCFSACDYLQMCCPNAYNLSSRSSQIISRITGMTFLGENIVQLIIKKELKKATKENFKVDLESYSIKDLTQGRFKSLNISGKHLKIDGVYLTSFESKTVCGFNYIQLDKNNIKFRENMIMDYVAEISDTDLQKTMQSAGYLDRLHKIKLSSLGITFFRLKGVDVQIKNNKLYFIINVTSPMSTKSIPIVVRSSLKVKHGKIIISNVGFINMSTVISLGNAINMLTILNPVNFSMKVLANKKSKMNIKSVDIVGDRIVIKGNIFIAKDVK